MAIPPYIPPIPRASGGTGTIQAGAAPTPPPKAPHPGEEVLMQGSMSRFGGRLLRRKDALGLGIITFAVENAGNGPYLTESLRLYRRLNRLELPLIRLAESSPLGRYTLFDFEIHPEELSLLTIRTAGKDGILLSESPAYAYVPGETHSADLPDIPLLPED